MALRLHCQSCLSPVKNLPGIESMLLSLIIMHTKKKIPKRLQLNLPWNIQSIALIAFQKIYYNILSGNQMCFN